MCKSCYYCNGGTGICGDCKEKQAEMLNCKEEQVAEVISLPAAKEKTFNDSLEVIMQRVVAIMPEDIQRFEWDSWFLNFINIAVDRELERLEQEEQ